MNKTSLPQALLAAPSPAALRDELEQLVLLDLLGPAGGTEEEVNESNVQDRYLVGMLAPSYKHMMPEELEELELAESSGGEGGVTSRSLFSREISGIYFTRGAPLCAVSGGERSLRTGVEAMDMMQGQSESRSSLLEMIKSAVRAARA